MSDLNSWLIDCSVVDVPEAGWREAAVFRGHRWAEPDVVRLRVAMREVFEGRDAARYRAEAGREHVRAHFSREAVARLVRDHLIERLDGRSC
jgi:hypothetical protein